MPVERERLRRVIDRLAERHPAAGEDARAAVEWVTAGEEGAAPAVFTRRRLKLFLWYGIEPFRRIYDLRHTFATFALPAGISTFELSRYMGAPA